MSHLLNVQQAYDLYFGEEDAEVTLFQLHHPNRRLIMRRQTHHLSTMRGKETLL